jgi:S-adenosyl methyltransferase
MSMGPPPGGEAPAPEIDTAVPHSARTWSYRLGGTDNLLDLVEPGVVACPRWRPDPGGEDVPDVDAFGGVGRKP